MLAYPDGNVLGAEWKVDMPKGHAFKIQYALTDYAARLSTNGLKFSVVATGADGKRHTLLEDVLNKGDVTVRDKSLTLDRPIRKIALLHDNLGREAWDVLWIRPKGLDLSPIPDNLWARKAPPPRRPAPRPASGKLPDRGEVASLRLAVEDLAATFPRRYARGREFLARLDLLEKQLAEKNPDDAAAAAKEIEALRREALVANPRLCDQPILFVVRHQYRSHYHAMTRSSRPTNSTPTATAGTPSCSRGAGP